MDAKKTLEKLRGEAEKKSYSLYFSKSIYEEFEKVCGELTPSKVMEELMKEFTRDAKRVSSKKKSAKKS